LCSGRQPFRHLRRRRARFRAGLHGSGVGTRMDAGVDRGRGRRTMGHRAIRNRAAHLIGALALLLASLLPASANAWGYYGHQTTARIALTNVKPETRTAIARLIAHESELGTPECRMGDLAGAATWPDCLRGSYWRWAYTFAWHYRTAPVCEAYDAKKHCSGGNCVTAQVERNFRILSDESLPA